MPAPPATRRWRVSVAEIDATLRWPLRPGAGWILHAPPSCRRPPQLWMTACSRPSPMPRSGSGSPHRGIPSGAGHDARGDGEAVPGRHAVRALRRRYQPQPRRKRRRPRSRHRRRGHDRGDPCRGGDAGPVRGSLAQHSVRSERVLKIEGVLMRIFQMFLLGIPALCGRSGGQSRWQQGPVASCAASPKWCCALFSGRSASRVSICSWLLTLRRRFSRTR